MAFADAVEAVVSHADRMNRPVNPDFAHLSIDANV